jgi:hypothetical protein
MPKEPQGPQSPATIAPLNEKQLTERADELRRIAAQTPREQDRQKLLKYADEFEAFARRMSAPDKNR